MRSDGLSEIRHALCKVCRRKVICGFIGKADFYNSDQRSCFFYKLPYGLYGDPLLGAVLNSEVLPPAKDAQVRIEDWAHGIILSQGDSRPVYIIVSVGLGVEYLHMFNSVDDPEAVLAVLKEAAKFNKPRRTA